MKDYSSTPDVEYTDLNYCRPEDVHQYRRTLVSRILIDEARAEVEIDIASPSTPYITSGMADRLVALRLAQARNDLESTKIALARSREDMRRRLAVGSARALSGVRELADEVDELLYEKRAHKRDIREIEADPASVVRHCGARIASGWRAGR